MLFQSLPIPLSPEKVVLWDCFFTFNMHYPCGKVWHEEILAVFDDKKTNQNVVSSLLIVPHFKWTMPNVINYYLIAGWRLQKATVSSLLILSTRVLQVDIKSVAMSAWNIHDLIGFPADTSCSFNLERKVRIQRTDGNRLK